MPLHLHAMKFENAGITRAVDAAATLLDKEKLRALLGKLPKKERRRLRALGKKLAALKEEQQQQQQEGKQQEGERAKGGAGESAAGAKEL